MRGRTYETLSTESRGIRETLIPRGENMKEKEKKFKVPVAFLIRLPLIIGTIILIAFIALKFGGAFEEGETEIVTESTLIKTVDIAELSTAEFTYNGIADIPKSEGSDKIKCRVRYEAKVKASVNMEDIKFEIDDENKTVKPILPEITLTPVLDDQEGFSFIPEDSDVDLQEVMEVCKEDVTNEANETSELTKSAEENLKDTIQALTYPILNSKGYTLVWE